jgi:hypothetical protein
MIDRNFSCWMREATEQTMRWQKKIEGLECLGVSGEGQVA